MLFHYGLTSTADTQTGIDIGDSSDFLFIAVGRHDPLQQLRFRLRVRCLHCGEQKERTFVRAYVSTDGFAEGVRITVHIEQVVLNLEGQTDMQTELIERFQLRVCASCDIAADTHSVRQKNGGLLLNHLHVIVNGHLTHMLEIHIHLLPLAYAGSHVVEPF